MFLELFLLATEENAGLWRTGIFTPSWWGELAVLTVAGVLTYVLTLLVRAKDRADLRREHQRKLEERRNHHSHSKRKVVE